MNPFKYHHTSPARRWHGRTAMLAAALAASVCAASQTDMTSKLTNASFENGFTGWTQYGLQTQTNNIFDVKDGTVYAEKWTGRGGAVGACLVCQDITGLPAGVYELAAVAQNIQEDTPTAAQTGCCLFAGIEETPVSTRGSYTVRFTVPTTASTTTVGFKALSASGNWLAVDGFRLTQVAAGQEAVTAELRATLTDAIGAALDAAAAAQARAVLENSSATPSALLQALETLRSANFKYRLDHATGTPPSVTTDQRYTRGSTVAFARSTVSGSAAGELMEKGMCWSAVNSEPTVLDERSTLSYNYNGDVFILPNLQPSTAYYVRAYAMTRDYAVGYGPTIKVVTIPRGTVTWWYNNGADADANSRINAALAGAVDYWNRLSGISGFGVSCSYGSGTPTADCSYGGSMRIGPNASYQRTGTVMHEMLHGIGVGTHNMWWNGEMRSDGNRGLWYGNRTSEVLRFWDNNTDGILNGDATHMWPYGINGAQEDNGSDILYTITSLLAGALGEDGLPPTWGAFATPAYVFPQTDNVKYYLKSEDENCGRNTSYLRQRKNGTLAWEAMDSGTAQANDSVAWYITFDPSTRCYAFRNVATGQYIAYSSTGNNGFRATTAKSRLQLMKGRIDIDVDGTAHRGYWLLRPSAGDAPATMAATAGGTIAAETYNLANASTAQRWLILTAEDITAFDAAYTQQARSELLALIQHARNLAAQPHEERVGGIDAQLTSCIDEAARVAAGTAADEMTAQVASVRAAIMDFLENSIPTDTPFDLTFLLANTGFDSDAAGWDGSQPTVSQSCAEFYETTFNMSQTLAGMPAGDYRFCLQGFQRTGDGAATLTAYNSSNNKVTAYLYANARSTKIASAAADRQPQPLFNDGGWGSDVELSDGTYIPNCMTGAVAYFKQGFYDNQLDVSLAKTGNLKVGVRCTSSASLFWTIFDNARLYYFGNHLQDGLREMATDTDGTRTDAKWYDLSGREVAPPGARSTSGGRLLITRGQKRAATTR